MDTLEQSRGRGGGRYPGAGRRLEEGRLRYSGGGCGFAAGNLVQNGLDSGITEVRGVVEPVGADADKLAQDIFGFGADVAALVAVLEHEKLQQAGLAVLEEDIEVRGKLIAIKSHGGSSGIGRGLILHCGKAPVEGGQTAFLTLKSVRVGAAGHGAHCRTEGNTGDDDVMDFHGD